LNWKDTKFTGSRKREVSRGNHAGGASETK
jgi:hypothetical protein